MMQLEANKHVQNLDCLVQTEHVLFHAKKSSEDALALAALGFKHAAYVVRDVLRLWRGDMA